MKKISYSMADRIIAFTLYKGRLKDGIGLFSMKRITELTGHSAASFQMKVDQFKGVAGCRKKTYTEKEFGPGLSEWAVMDERVWNKYKDIDPTELIKIAKDILNKLWKENSCTAK